MSESVKVSRRGSTRISRKHQITVPVDALRAADLAPGDRLRVEAQGRGRLVVTRMGDVVADYAGTMPGVWERDGLDALRDEWR